MELRSIIDDLITLRNDVKSNVNRPSVEQITARIEHAVDRIDALAGALSTAATLRDTINAVGGGMRGAGGRESMTIAPSDVGEMPPLGITPSPVLSSGAGGGAGMTVAPSEGSADVHGEFANVPPDQKGPPA